MATQARISATRLARKVGSTLDVLVDEVNGTRAVARSKADAPEIDGVVHVTGAKGLRPGTFARVIVTGTATHDLTATLSDPCP